MADEEIYWDTPAERPASRYVYHACPKELIGHWLIPLNEMPKFSGFEKTHAQALSKYKGREHLLQCKIPTLNCLWNDVIFLSPIHPHKQYEEYKKIGFSLRNVRFYQIPVELLQGKRLTVWKWLSYKKYPENHPIHDAFDSYCNLDFANYRELDELPEDTREFYRMHFDPNALAQWPPFLWYRIPHILCQDPIDLSDPRITVIEWQDPVFR